MNMGIIETFKELSEEDKRNALSYAEFIKSQRKEPASNNIQDGISDITSLFKELPAGSRKEALATMEHTHKYNNIDFWNYQNKVFEMSCVLDDLRNLFAVLYENCFSWDERKIEQDKVEREIFLRSYGKIKTLISTMWNIAGNVAKIAYALSNADIRESERAERN